MLVRGQVIHGASHTGWIDFVRSMVLALGLTLEQAETFAEDIGWWRLFLDGGPGACQLTNRYLKIDGWFFLKSCHTY